MIKQLAVQMYTLRDETQNDFKGTLEKVAELGYKGAEFAGYGNLTASELKNCLDRLGLKAAGSHVSLDLLKDSLDEQIDYNLEIGNPFIVCPWSDPKSRQEYLELAAILNKVGEKCKNKGLQLCYHNHAHEFNTFDGEYGIDIIFNNTDAELVKAEVDTYWVQRAGLNPVQFIKKNSGRCPLVHLKDMESGEEKFFAEVGNGVMDFSSIIASANEAGAAWMIVEQDKCRRPALESVTISYQNLKKMGMI